jgi:hypothetical protein
MPEPIDILPNSTSTKTGYASQPQAQGPDFSRATYSHNGAGSGNFMMKPYLVGAVIAVLVAFLVFQQVQISHLSQELQQINDSVKSSDVRNRLDAVDQKLQEVDNRLGYLDSKINAVDQKAQISLEKWKAQEDNDFFGNMIKGIKQGLGIH